MKIKLDFSKSVLIKLKTFFIKWYPFLIAFIIMTVYLKTTGSMVDKSGDAADIWKTITSWGTDKVYGSYVMYKGFESIYPYVWFYKLGLLADHQFVFIKIYYAFAMAFVTTVALPSIVNSLTGEKVKNYRKLVVFFVCFYFWEYTVALKAFIVDLPSLFYFATLAMMALWVHKFEKSVAYHIFFGFFLGLNLCASGQYTLPAIGILIYFLLEKHKILKNNGKNLKSFFSLFLVLLVAVGLKIYNNYFINYVVGALREQGAWIPTGKCWIEIGHMLYVERYAMFRPTIDSNRMPAIYKDFFGGEFEKIYASRALGSYHITVKEYLGIVAKYPLDFFACYFIKLFLSLSPTHRIGLHFVPLCLFYSFIFVSLVYVRLKLHCWKDFFTSKLWIFLAFLAALAAPVVMHVEARYGMQLQGLIISVALCTDLIWVKLDFMRIKFIEKFESLKNRMLTAKINYTVVVYMFFIILCFMCISLLYEKSDFVLFKFF